MATLACYALSNVLVAVAPLFSVVAIGRILGGVTHALFFSLVIGYSPRLVSGAHVGRALALAGSGASAGLVLGVPLLTSLGTAAGWRGSFAVLAVLSALTFALVVALLPRVEHESMSTRRQGGGCRRLAAVATSNALVFLGQFTVYTFISVLLLAGGVGPAFLGPILLACGACGLLGLWFAGRGLDRNPRRTAVIVVALILGAVVVLGVTWPTVVAVVIATAIWSGAFGGVPSIYQACAVRAQAMPPNSPGRGSLHRQHRNCGRSRHRCRPASHSRARVARMAGRLADGVWSRGDPAVSQVISAPSIASDISQWQVLTRNMATPCAGIWTGPMLPVLSPSVCAHRSRTR